jgi:hypothetical protein
MDCLVSKAQLGCCTSCMCWGFGNCLYVAAWILATAAVALLQIG